MPQASSDKFEGMPSLAAGIDLPTTQESDEEQNSDEEQKSAAPKQRRQPIRLNPDRVPVLTEEVAFESSLASMMPVGKRRGRSKFQLEQARRDRLDKNAKGRETRRLMQLAQATTQEVVRQKAAERRRRDALEAKRAREHEADLAEEQLARNELDKENLPDLVQNTLRKRRRGTVKPRVEEATRRRIQEEFGSMSARRLGEKFGVDKNTVTRIGNENSTVEKRKGGRKPKMTPDMEKAAAVYQFLFNTRSTARTCSFLQRFFHVSLCERTVRKHLKECGFRIGNFRKYPKERNSEEALKQREQFAHKHKGSELIGALYFDEMKLTRQTKRRAWSIMGFVPEDVSEPHKDLHTNLTLLLCASPELGLVHYEIVQDSVTSATVVQFLQNTIFEHCKSENGTDKERLFVMGNARIHHTEAVQDVFGGEGVRSKLKLCFLPTCSPFLNPVEELFGIIMMRLWHKRSHSSSTDESVVACKRSLIQVIHGLDKDLCMNVGCHAQQFIQMAKDRQHVTSQKLYDSANPVNNGFIDESVKRDMDLITRRSLPYLHEEFTPCDESDYEDMLRRRRVTPEDLMRHYPLTEADFRR